MRWMNSDLRFEMRSVVFPSAVLNHQPVAYLFRSLNADGFRSDSDRSSCRPVVLLQIWTILCFVVDLAFELLLASIRCEDLDLNFEVRRVQENCAFLESVDVKRRQNQNRFFFFFGPLNNCIALYIADGCCGNVFDFVEMAEELGKDGVFA